MMRKVYIKNVAAIPIERKSTVNMRDMASTVYRNLQCNQHTDPEKIQALYLSNMLGDAMENQKHLASLIADHIGLRNVDAMEVRAASASGAAALRAGFQAIRSGMDDILVLGLERMSSGDPTPALAMALDAIHEVPRGTNMITANAEVMQLYMDRYNVSHADFAPFSINAHANAEKNPLALFKRQIDQEKFENAKPIALPLRLYDCSPVCDGAAILHLSSTASSDSIEILGSASATDRFRTRDREDATYLKAAEISFHQALAMSGIDRQDIDFFEVHDAFTIMACLLLEACGFARPGKGTELAKDGTIFTSGSLPLATMGGLKGRGHPVGASAIYQAFEIYQQLTGNAGACQLPSAPQTALMQSIGGAGTTILTHIMRQT